jgi:hypothetical protein
VPLCGPHGPLSPEERIDCLADDGTFVDTAPYLRCLTSARERTGQREAGTARTCRELGVATVTVCSTVDRDSAVAEFADEPSTSDCRRPRAATCPCRR